MSLFGKFFAKNVLYYPGCTIKYASKDLDENYREILKKLGIEFLTFDEFSCCGSPVLNAGFKEDFDSLKQKNIELLQKYGINLIITPCPACARMFKQEYQIEKKGIKVKHISEVVAENLSKIKEMKKETKNITYHDPCHLGRHLKIYDEPRKALLKAGYNLIEFNKTRENADCCGAGGGVKANFPEISNEIAKRRIKQCKTNLLVTSCPLCYLHLKENTNDQIEVKEFSQILKEML